MKKSMIAIVVINCIINQVALAKDTSTRYKLPDAINKHGGPSYTSVLTTISRDNKDDNKVSIAVTSKIKKLKPVSKKAATYAKKHHIDETDPTALDAEIVDAEGHLVCRATSRTETPTPGKNKTITFEYSQGCFAYHNLEFRVYANALNETRDAYRYASTKVSEQINKAISVF